MLPSVPEAAFAVIADIDENTITDIMAATIFFVSFLTYLPFPTVGLNAIYLILL